MSTETPVKTLALTALHEIIRDAANGKREVLAPRSLFLAVDQAQYDVFVKAQAAREPTAEELAAGSAKLQAAAADTAGPKALADMNQNELKAEATKREIQFTSNASKADLRKLIEDYDAANAGGGLV